MTLCCYVQAGNSKAELRNYVDKVDNEYVIISDFDDTIKRSYLGSSFYVGAIANALNWKKEYWAMPELLQAMKVNAAGLVILSASPHILRAPIQKLLKSNSINYQYLFTRDLLGQDKEDFKYNAIYDVIYETQKNIVLLGDDLELDPDIYRSIRDDFSDNVQAIYIHKVLNETDLSDLKSYFIPFEVSLYEYEEGRVNLEQVKVIGRKIYNAQKEDIEDIIPDYAYCPLSVDEFYHVSDRELQTLQEKIYQRLVQYCRSRD
jgi:phosphatidate phosphatase APP1|tara:strand:+ start:472 stop:1254 length:783 start_codon:yes stop_codon:yes gene_type:complete